MFAFFSKKFFGGRAPDYHTAGCSKQPTKVVASPPTAWLCTPYGYDNDNYNYNYGSLIGTPFPVPLDASIHATANSTPAKTTATPLCVCKSRSASRIIFLKCAKNCRPKDYLSQVRPENYKALANVSPGGTKTLTRAMGGGDGALGTHPHEL